MLQLNSKYEESATNTFPRSQGNQIDILELNGKTVISKLFCSTILKTGTDLSELSTRTIISCENFIKCIKLRFFDRIDSYLI